MDLESRHVLPQVLGLPVGQRDHRVRDRGEGQQPAREAGLAHWTGVPGADLADPPRSCVVDARVTGGGDLPLPVGQVDRHDPAHEGVAHHRHRRVGDRRVGEDDHTRQPAHQPVQPVGDPVIAGEGLVRPAAPRGSEPLVPPLVVVHRGRLGQPAALSPCRQRLVDLRLRMDRGHVGVPPGLMEGHEPAQPRAGQATLLLPEVAEHEQRDGSPGEVGAGVGHGVRISVAWG
jgi:hypothetical protein